MADKPTIFDLCVDQLPSDTFDELWRRTLVKSVLQTVIAHTGSPYTVDELTRILAEADSGDQ